MMPVGDIFLSRTKDNECILHFYVASYVLIDPDVRSIIDVANFYDLNHSCCHPGCPFS